MSLAGSVQFTRRLINGWKRPKPNALRQQHWRAKYGALTSVALGYRKTKFTRLRLVVAKNSRFGYAWVIFALALAVHVLDEATHDFLSFYNSSVMAIRERLPFLTLPTFTFRVWLAGLIAGIILLLCLSPLAFRATPWLRIIAMPLSIIIGVFNASGHILSSVYYQRWMPGVYSSPFLLMAGLCLLVSSVISCSYLDIPINRVNGDQTSQS